MPSTTDYAWLHRPLEVVRMLTSNVINGVDQCTDEDMGVQEYFKTILSKKENTDLVPILTASNAELLRPGSLVRMRGMVHHTFDRRYCICKGSAILSNGEKRPVCGLYQSELQVPDGAHIDPHAQSNTFIAQTEVYVTPIPGQNTWVTEMLNGKQEVAPGTAGTSDARLDTGLSIAAGKRQQSDEADNGMSIDEDTLDTESKRVKAAASTNVPLHTNSSSDRIPADGAGANGETSTEINTDTSKDGATDSQGASLSAGMGVYEETVGAAVVTLYGSTEDPAINTHVDVYGILSEPVSTPITAEQPVDDPMGMFPELDTAVAPQHMPRLQAVHLESVLSTNPITTTVDSLSNEDIAKARATIIEILSEALCGDVAAAEYVLMHLLSSTPISESAAPNGAKPGPRVGKVSLNLFGACDAQMVANIEDILRSLTPTTVKIPLVMDTLNAERYWPVQDGESQRLRKSLLQVAPRITHFLIDEVALQTGKLNDTGVKNLQAIQNLLVSGVVPYQFETYEMRFECDATTLVLSEGKSMLASELPYKLVPSSQEASSHTQTLRNVIQAGEIDQLRTYVAACRALPFTIDDATREKCISDYVELRKASPDTVTPETLDRLLTLARYCTISFGKSLLSADIWVKVQRGENERNGRLPIPPSAPVRGQ
ncbi:hypothetical protein SARC_07136 [Sphaeroforma arctica JP610]|uniref:Mini-chromosome maintenance complex-binding protein n=1 Tax=Sphaeroforma arctica JP610 TaxID=667725 RepID=A0A0L0FV30_9EUKA|nr:hypothetical protein SARC_07136 [Sphaeroforma arctica JP610]KNC80494.1 hypothetical protein SARC_07136 [Sphaeroforma arctica JP610]|eukprot:XP_014154396.1 hypothetical protein SARC_07136 [Sphaeroforma arctica JP610]